MTWDGLEPKGTDEEQRIIKQATDIVGRGAVVVQLGRPARWECWVGEGKGKALLKGNSPHALALQVVELLKKGGI